MCPLLKGTMLFTEGILTMAHVIFAQVGGVVLLDDLLKEAHPWGLASL